MNAGMKRTTRTPTGETKKVELIEHAARLEAMDRLLEELPAPSKRGMARLDAELAAPLRAPR